MLPKFMHIVAGMLQFTKVYKQRSVRRRRFARAGPVFMTWDSIFTIDVQVLVATEFKNQIHITMDVTELLDGFHLCAYILWWWHV